MFLTASRSRSALNPEPDSESDDEEDADDSPTLTSRLDRGCSVSTSRNTVLKTSYRTHAGILM